MNGSEDYDTDSGIEELLSDELDLCSDNERLLDVMKAER